MKMIAIYLALVDEFSKGLELRELTANVNRKLKTNYLQSTMSARIREMRGMYRTRTEQIKGVKHVYYSDYSTFLTC